MLEKKEIIADPKLIAYCGLYCGACNKYLVGKCPGCALNEKASWCKVRTCNIENKYKSCSDCTICKVEECKKMNNFMAKIFALIFKSDRVACVNYIKKEGYDAFAQKMTDNKMMTFKRK
jgi:hypothetical protein